MAVAKTGEMRVVMGWFVLATGRGVPATPVTCSSGAASRSRSTTGGRSVWLVRSEAEKFEQAGCGDTVGVADAEDPAGKLLPAGEIIGLSAAQAERAGGGHQIDGRGGAQLRDGHGCHVSLLASRAVAG